MLRCNYCHEEKQKKEFYEANKKCCKKCCCLRASRWMKNHPERTRETSKKSKAKRRDKIAVYYRRWYETNGRTRRDDYRLGIKEWARKNPEKVAARRMVRKAIISGGLRSPCRCSKCNRKTKVQAHHPDYLKPLKVVWLCASCHKKHHLNKGT